MSKTKNRIEKIKQTLMKRQPTLTIVLENVNDPHNVSAIVRSCDAVGVMDVCLVYTDENIVPEIAGASSAGAKKWIDVRRFSSIEQCIETLKGERKKIYSTHMSEKAVSLYALDFTVPSALVFGNEHDGVSKEAVELADANFLIPQVGFIQSLNISVACAVSLYEAFRQRNAAGMYDVPQLTGEAFDAKIAEWIEK